MFRASGSCEIPLRNLIAFASLTFANVQLIGVPAGPAGLNLRARLAVQYCTAAALRGLPSVNASSLRIAVQTCDALLPEGMYRAAAAVALRAATVGLTTNPRDVTDLVCRISADLTLPEDADLRVCFLGDPLLSLPFVLNLPSGYCCIVRLMLNSSPGPSPPRSRVCRLPVPCRLPHPLSSARTRTWYQHVQQRALAHSLALRPQRRPH
jgi:hypothetical protein